MWLWVTNCPQGQLGDVDQAAFAALKYCRNMLCSCDTECVLQSYIQP